MTTTFEIAAEMTAVAMNDVAKGIVAAIFAEAAAFGVEGAAAPVHKGVPDGRVARVHQVVKGGEVVRAAVIFPSEADREARAFAVDPAGRVAESFGAVIFGAGTFDVVRKVAAAKKTRSGEGPEGAAVTKTPSEVDPLAVHPSAGPDVARADPPGVAGAGEIGTTAAKVVADAAVIAIETGIETRGTLIETTLGPKCRSRLWFPDLDITPTIQRSLQFQVLTAVHLVVRRRSHSSNVSTSVCSSMSIAKFWGNTTATAIKSSTARNGTAWPGATTPERTTGTATIG
jgi:hypothetical protein